MKLLEQGSTIGVIGLGTMGIGIAQVAARAGHRVLLFDSSENILRKAKEKIEDTYKHQTQKGKLSQEEATQLLERMVPVYALRDFENAGFIIEAILEEVEIKRQLFSELENSVSSNCILATNTSSLSVASIASACKNPRRFLAAHFFNPATVMPLVELVPCLETNKETLAISKTLLDHWGKLTVVAQDTPGFIVNRIARPYYGEALRILEEQIATVSTIDWAMTSIGGFRMGPFQLMDFIGNDINFKATESVFNASYYDPRYRPSLLQKRLVETRRLGRKTNIGFYDYQEGAKHPAPDENKKLGQTIFERIFVMLVNEASEALSYGIASREDIDLAMMKGVNYPQGLLSWGDEFGLKKILSTLENLQSEYGEDRYRPSALLKRLVREGKTFYKEI